MNRLVIVCTCMALSLSCWSQTTSLTPVTVQKGSKTYTVGCTNMQPLDRMNLALLKEQVLYADVLMTDLIAQLDTMAGSSAVAPVKREQKEWFKVRDKYCVQEANQRPSSEREIGQMSCKEWANWCRLQELMETFDRLVPSEE